VSDEQLKSIRSDIDQMIELAQWGIANEKLGGNVVKEEFWKGQLSALRFVTATLDNP
jgi:hypothetical protein